MANPTTCIIGGKIILDKSVITDKALIFDDKIIAILDVDDFEKTRFAQNSLVINANGFYVSPGFIDLHIHGAGGKDTMDGTLTGLETISESIAKNGVTGFLPTTLSMESEKIYQALDAISLAMRKEPVGAKILGAHMEGPFLSPVYFGAHDVEYLQKADFQFIENYLDVIKIITFAPEEDPEFRFIKQVLAESGIVLSMGHTNADYETAMKALKLGVSHATHLFNAMPPFLHRAPGPVGSVLNSHVTYELIADTIHVHPALFQILLNSKGNDKMILVTDSTRAAGMEAGIWELGGQKVITDGNSARLADGKLAGSIIGMNEAVHNILEHTKLEIHEAVGLASINPAKLIGLDQAKGSIEIGKDADIIFFDDKLNVKLTIMEGRIIYSGFRSEES
jgi:N-acetylglucosamine-6-phosphate deacetylase